MRFFLQLILLLGSSFVNCLYSTAQAAPANVATHGYALWNDLKYPADFSHFDYVNAQAPKGGELRLVSNLRLSTYDKYNPFSIKGNAPAYLSDMLFDSLLAGAADESGSGYGLLAQTVVVAPDGRSVVFQLNPAAKFHNGSAVLAQDVKYTFDTLMGAYTSPAYKTALADVAGIDVLNERTVRFRFSKPSRELPLTLGGLPIFSHQWGAGKTFDKVVMDIPIGSGPYKIGAVKFGKDITYERDPQYWARDLNVRKGTANFDKISVKIYADNTAKLEALKAGEFDLMRFFSAGDWARRVNGKKFDSGELVKGVFQHRLPAGFQSYVLNIRRPILQDIRVREALGLAMDFEWMSRQFFYGSYQRVQGLFGNTDCHAEGLPSSAELKLLAPFKGQIPDSVWGAMVQAPRTDYENGLRMNLRKARQLLVSAGWTIQNGVLKNAKGEAFKIEYLDSNESGARVITPWARNLEKLGIQLTFRPVDFALYQERLDKFDFDMISLAYQGTHNPGQEFADMFGSKAADTPNSGNFPGVKSAAVDALINQMVASKSKAELLPACRALDRVITHSHYLIPQWFANTHRLAYNGWRLEHPRDMPPYASGEGWAIDTWWAKLSSNTSSSNTSSSTAPASTAASAVSAATAK